MAKIMIAVIMIIVMVTMAFADGNHDFTEAKQLIESKVSCADLSNEQLETMGDYYMEQMHPGEAHELMDEMMGGEGSDSLTQIHIQLARGFYCKEQVGGMIGGGMMNMMSSGGMMSMMGSGMMGGGTMMGYGTGMMSTGWWPLWQLLYLLIVVGVLVLIVLWIMKLWKDLQKRK